MDIKPEVVFVETSTHTYSLSEEGFGYNYGLLKKFIEPRVSWNSFIRDDDDDDDDLSSVILLASSCTHLLVQLHSSFKTHLFHKSFPPVC